jgi:hypothetical protein
VFVPAEFGAWDRVMAEVAEAVGAFAAGSER